MRMNNTRHEDNNKATDYGFSYDKILNGLGEAKAFDRYLGAIRQSLVNRISDVEIKLQSHLACRSIDSQNELIAAARALAATTESEVV